MDELFNILSSSARLDKSKKKLRKRNLSHSSSRSVAIDDDTTRPDDAKEEEESLEEETPPCDDGLEATPLKSRDRTGKRDLRPEKLKQIHQEQVAAFRRSMSIRLANRHDPDIADPLSSFHELEKPTWWKDGHNNKQPPQEENDYDHHDPLPQNDPSGFASIHKALLRNIEGGRWKEPTPIQMQAIPCLLQRRDLIGAAPTGSGKSGAFIIPALLLSSAPSHIFYGTTRSSTSSSSSLTKGSSPDTKQHPGSKSNPASKLAKVSQKGEIRALLLAPSLELASQLHREVERLGMGKPGGLSCLLLSKSNAAHVVNRTAGGSRGLDILVATPLRLVDAVEKGLRLDTVRMVVLDEADRLLDAADGSSSQLQRRERTKNVHQTESEEDDDEGESHNESDEDEDDDHQYASKPKGASSGSTQSRSFLSQMDVILSEVPPTATRALFSATVTPAVRSLAESILRNPVDITIAASGTQGGANPDIDQELMFVGREEGKLLAIRQLVQRGQLRPPVMVFVESQERAQALFGELLYDGIHVDVIHAGRSRSARENAVAKFRKGDTWVLICTDLVARGVDFRAVNMVINYDLPTSGVTYVHRVGRTGRAGRQGRAITLFTEADFGHLRTIANVMKQSGCQVEDWMLQLPKQKQPAPARDRSTIDTTPRYDIAKKRRKQQIIEQSKKKHKRGT